jgi:hypothetical protein
MEVSGQIRAPAASPRRKCRRYPLDRRLGGPRIRPGRGDEDIYIYSSLCRETNPCRPARLVSILTELTQLYEDLSRSFRTES